jgi:hypothetical protein
VIADTALPVIGWRGAEQTNYPLTIFALTGRSLELQLSWDQELLRGADVERLGEHLRTLVQGLAASTDGRISELPEAAPGAMAGVIAPAPALARPSKAAYVAPRTPGEEELVRLWERVLEVCPIGVEDDFFALGGHSLLALQMVAAVERHFDGGLTLAEVFSHRTVAEMAAALQPSGHLSRAERGRERTMDRLTNNEETS